MCGSMVDIQYAAAEIRRRKKEDRKKPQAKNIMLCPIHRATINTMSASATQSGHNDEVLSG